MREATDLQEEIESAFSWRAYPGDDCIVRRKAGCEGSEAEEAWGFFKGKSWRDVLAAVKDYDVRSSISFLTREGFLYYLPAFLILSMNLDDPFAPDNELVFHLWSFPEEISPHLKPAEKRATVHVLAFLSEEYARRKYPRNDAYVALDHYWAYFTDEELGLKPHVQE